MRPRIGISIDGDALHAVAVRRRAVVWSASCKLESRDAMRDTVATLLRPYPNVTNSRAIAALGAGHARVKPVHGFERVTRSELVEQAIQTNPERFFLKQEGGLGFSRAARTEDGAWQVASFSQMTTLAIESGCLDVGVELIRCVPAQSSTSAPLPPSVAEEFRRAYHAATSDGHTHLFSNSNATNARLRLRRRTRRRLLGAVTVSAFIAVLIAPTISAERSRRRAVAQLAEARIPLRPVAASMAALAHVTSMLRRVDEFDHSRHSMLRYLSSLADALPESTAVLSMRVDTVTATTVVVTRSGPSVLGEFAAMPQLVSPKLIGAMSREQIGGVEYDRLAVRAQIARTRDTTMTTARTR